MTRRIKSLLIKELIAYLIIALQILQTVNASPCKSGKLTGTICSECETGYTLVLYSKSEIICGKVTGNTCTVESTDYPS